MTLDALLATLAEKDVQLWLDGEKLRYRAPADALTDELMAELKRHKGAILERLSGPAPVSFAPSSWAGAPTRMVPPSIATAAPSQSPRAASAGSSWASSVTVPAWATLAMRGSKTVASRTDRIVRGRERGMGYLVRVEERG